MASPRNVKLDRAQDAIIRGTRRVLGEKMTRYAAAFIERYGSAFNLRDFLQTGKTPILVSLPPTRVQIFSAATSLFINATWTHTNEKDRYRIVLKTGMTLDAGDTVAAAIDIPAIIQNQINGQGQLLITRRARVQTEAFRRFNMGTIGANQGLLAGGAAPNVAQALPILDEALLHMGVEEALKQPFDTLQPDETFTMGMTNLSALDAAGAFNSNIFATLHGMAIDIITG